MAHHSGVPTTVGGRAEEVSAEGVADGRWRPVVGARRRPASGRCSRWCRRGRRRTGVCWRHGGSWWQRRSSVSSLWRLCSMTRWLARDWKVEEAPVSQLLGRSRRSGRARSTAANLVRAESRGTRRHEESGMERGSPRRGARSG
jgi:hypothetical protein